MLTMVDLKISNIQSVREAFQRVGAAIQIVSSPQDVERASAVILPGVGAFGDGMESLSDQQLIEPLRRHALTLNKPLLGVCLGMQLLAESSHEHGLHEGLGIIKGRTEKLEANQPGLRVPNMGWCDVTIQSPQSVLFAKHRTSDPIFYFAHSFHLHCADTQDVAATLDFGGEVTAAIEHGNIFGLQFHPEKSQSAGLEVLEAFCQHIAQNYGS
jgi:imidazole glycerol-phosphate synthase subunit HisH